MTLKLRSKARRSTVNNHDGDMKYDLLLIEETIRLALREYRKYKEDFLLGVIGQKL